MRLLRQKIYISTPLHFYTAKTFPASVVVCSQNHRLFTKDFHHRKQLLSPQAPPALFHYAAHVAQCKCHTRLPPVRRIKAWRVVRHDSSLESTLLVNCHRPLHIHIAVINEHFAGTTGDSPRKEFFSAAGILFGAYWRGA
jgi:hypothetical protein